MVSGNSITSENLITAKKLINNWQIASISKKKKVWKIRVNSTRPDPINPFKNDPFWPTTRLTWPNLPVLSRLIFMIREYEYCYFPSIFYIHMLVVFIFYIFYQHLKTFAFHSLLILSLSNFLFMFHIYLINVRDASY